MCGRRRVSFVKRNRFAIMAALVCGAVFTGVLILNMEYGLISAVFAWRMLLVSMGGLFLILSESHLLQREKDRYYTLKKESGTRVMLCEAGYQLFLFGTFFLLFITASGSQPMSWRRELFFFIAALVSTLSVTHISFSSDFRRIIPWIGYAVILLYSIYVLSAYGYIRWSRVGSFFLGKPLERISPWITGGFIVLEILEFQLDRKRAAAIFLIESLLIPAANISGRRLFAEFCAVVLLSNLLGEPRTTAKFFTGLFVSYILFLAVGLWMGLVENVAFYFPYAGYVNSYGMGHSNLAGLVLMSLLLLIWYLWMKEHPVVTGLVFWICATGIWIATYSRTTVLLICFFPLLNALRYLPEKSKKICLRLLVWLPLVFAGISLAGMYWVPNQQLISTNESFFARFTIPYKAILNYGIRLTGTTGAERYIVDNLFLHALLFFGVISFLMLPILLLWVGMEYERNRQEAELILFGIFMLYSLMENALIHMPFGFAMIMMSGRANTQTPGRQKKHDPICRREDKTEAWISSGVKDNQAEEKKKIRLAGAIGLFLVMVIGCLWGIQTVEKMQDAFRFKEGELLISARLGDSTLELYNIQGLSIPEAGFTWTEGNKVQMEIPIKVDCETVIVEIDIAGTFSGLQNYSVQDQQEQIIQTGSLEGPGQIVFSAVVEEHRILFSLLLPDARRVLDVDPESDDSRMLALQIKKIKVSVPDQ